jgi:hypothetical protein
MSNDQDWAFPDDPLKPNEAERLTRLLQRRRLQVKPRRHNMVDLAATRFQLPERVVQLLPPGFGHADQPGNAELEAAADQGLALDRSTVTDPALAMPAQTGSPDRLPITEPANSTALQERLQPVAEQLPTGSPRVIDPPIVDRIARLLRRPLPPVQIYTNPAADRLAQAAGADALAYPGAVAFRSDAYHPERREGFALLAHELSHVTDIQTGSAPAPGSAERQAGEQRAQAVERAALTTTVAVPPDRPIPPVTADTSPAPALPPLRFNEHPPVPPQPALSDRDVELSPPPAPTPIGPEQLAIFKDEIMRDLIDRIRTDFERGA